MIFKIDLIQSESKEWDKSLFFSILFIFMLFGCLQAFYFPIIWNETDDIAMKRIVSGYYSGKNYPSLIFINVFWGYILKYLYIFKQDIQWYSWIFVFLYQIVNSIIVFIALRKGIKWISIFTVLIIFYYQLIFFNLEYQFSIIASLCAMCGYIIIIFGTIENQKSALWYIIAGIMLVISSIIRKESFYLISILFLANILYLFIYNKTFNRFRIIYPLIIIMIFYAINFFYYNNSTWKEYFEFTKYRSHIVDNHNISFDLVSSQISWTESEFDFIKSHQYECIEPFTISKYKEFYSIFYTGLFENLEHMNISKYKLKITYIIFLIILLSFLMKNKSLNIFLFSFVSTMLFLLFISKYKRIPDRVMLPALFGSLCFILYFVQSYYIIKINKKFISFAIVGFFGFFWLYFKEINAHLDRVKLFDNFFTKRGIAFFSSFKEHQKGPQILLSLHSDASKVLSDFRVFERHQIYTNDFKLIPRGWLTKTPFQEDFAKKYQIQNVCRLDASSDTHPILLVDIYPNKKMFRYIKEHYSQYEIDTVYKAKSGSFCAFKFSKKFQ